MANPNELKLAQERFESTKRILAAVEALPQKVGSKVMWSNGVTWTRLGDNKWEGVSTHAPDYRSPWPASSAHLASGEIVEVIGK